MAIECVLFFLACYVVDDYLLGNVGAFVLHRVTLSLPLAYADILEI